MVDAGEHHDGADPASLVFGKVGYRMLSYYLDLAGVAVAVGRGARRCVCAWPAWCAVWPWCKRWVYIDG